MLEAFITSVLIIDDSEKEIGKLKEYLEEKDIWVKHYTPTQLDKITSDKLPFNNRKLIFLDLYLEDGAKIESNISKIRGYFTKILSRDFGTYGIVLWTKHTDEYNAFVERIYKTSDKYTAPLFVIPLEKNKYLKDDDFSSVLEDLEENLKNDVASSFFIEWNKAVKAGSDKTISGLYNLFDSNEKKEKHLEPVLFKLAQNYSGFPINTSIKIDDDVEKGKIKSFLQKDLIKSLMDSLQFEISNNYQNVEILFKELSKLNYNETPEEKSKVFSKLNSLLMLDLDNLSQDSPIPGNIYEITDSALPVYIKELVYKKKNEDIDTHADFKDLNKRRICIELTPPCDFALNKKQSFSRIVGGIQLDFDKKLLQSTFSTENFYKYLHPVRIDGFENPQMIIFDFYRFQTIKEDELKDPSKYKIIAKTKDKLFADILQKLSSHTARLGIAILYP